MLWSTAAPLAICAPKRVVRNAAVVVSPIHGPQCSGTVTRGENSERWTKAGVSRLESSRCSAPAYASNPKYTGHRCHGACSTELKRASGALRTTTDVTGWLVKKFLSSTAAKLRLKPRKLLVRKKALRSSVFIASANVLANAWRNVSEESWLKSTTARQP